VIRLVSWNVAGRDLWGDLAGLEADVGLLQEAPPPRPESALHVLPEDLADWRTDGWRRACRTAVARLSDRVDIDPIPTVVVGESTGSRRPAASRFGTVTIADVKNGERVLLTVASVYAAWEGTRPGPIFADGSAHRLLSDLAPLMGSRTHRLVVAGDWNILLGYGEHGDAYYRARYGTVFDRAEALGLEFVGPRHPGGRQAKPWPEELPTDSLCVPTYHTNRQTPATATRQLDFVFASRELADRISVRAMNAVEDWGPSDHCRVIIDIDP